MADLRHSIRQQVLEIGYHNPNRAHELQEEVTRIYYQRLVGVIEEVMQQVAGDGLHLRLGTVELNLGTIYRDTLEEDFIERVRDQLLETLLERQMQVRQSAIPGEEEITLNHSLLAVLGFYLQYGSLPWWDQRIVKGSLENLFFELLRNEPAEIRALLVRIGRNRWVRQRIVRQFSENLVRAVVHNLEPAGYGYILSFVAEVQVANRSQRVVKTSESELRKALWEFVLTYLLVERGSVFNTRSFVKSILRQLGSRFTIPYGRLLTLMNQAVDELQNSWQFRTSLPYLIRSLYWEQFGREPESIDPLWGGEEQTKKNNKQGSPLELLSYYLHFGSLPWWGRKSAESDLDEVLQQILLQQPADLVSMLFREGRSTYVRQRLAHQFKETNIRKVIQVLEPVEAPFILAYSDQLLRSHQRKQLMQVSQRKFRRVRWEFVLTYLLVERGSTFNRKMFLSSVLRQMATRFKLSYEELLQLLIDDFQSLESKDLAAAPQLIRILLELQAEKATSEKALTSALAQFLSEQSTISEKDWKKLLKWWFGGKIDPTSASTQQDPGQEKWIQWMASQNLSINEWAPRILALLESFAGENQRLNSFAAWTGMQRSLRQLWSLAKSSPIADEPALEAKLENEAKEASVTDLIFFFLRTGTIPWWGKQRFPDLDLASLTLEWMEQTPERLLELVLGRSWKQSYTRRLLNITGSQMLLNWLVKVYGWQLSELQAWMALVSEWGEAQEAGGKSIEVRQTWRWYWLMVSLPGKPGEQPEFKRVLQTWMSNMAEAHGQETNAMVHKMAEFRLSLEQEEQFALQALFPWLRNARWAEIEGINNGGGKKKEHQILDLKATDLPPRLEAVATTLELQALLYWLQTGEPPEGKMSQRFDTPNALIDWLTERQWRLLSAFWLTWAQQPPQEYRLTAVLEITDLAHRLPHLGGSETNYLESRLLHLQLLFQQADGLVIAPAELASFLTESSYLFFFAFPVGERSEARWLRWVLQRVANWIAMPIASLVQHLVRVVRRGSDSASLSLVKDIVRLDRELNARALPQQAPPDAPKPADKNGVYDTSGFTEGPMPRSAEELARDLENSGLSKNDQSDLQAARERLLAQQQAAMLADEEAMKEAEANEKKSKQKEDPSTDKEEENEVELPEPVYVQNAGLVLAWPYLSPLFQRCGYLEGQQFKDEASAYRAVHLLQFMATGREGDPEYELVLNKILCGVKTAKPVEVGLELTKEEKELAESLLEGLIANWSVIGDTSPAGLRETFLEREGRLSHTDTGWILKISSTPYDVLLDQLPWSIKNIRLMWMENRIRVEWRDKPNFT